jgi:CubicO group peptidase (beta-lactamase class C family)
MPKVNWGMAVLALAALSAAGAAGAAPRGCAVPDFAREAEAVIAPYEEAQAFSGAVLVARDGRVVLRRGVGLADREWNVPNTPDTKFRLGSITKQFTAAAILQLAEQGKLSFDDPISKYYPEAPASWSKVTIRRLLTHTSGIPSYTTPRFMAGLQRAARTPEEIIKLTRDEPLEFEPGTKFAYDNTGYILLGYVIEKVSGQSYAAYLAAHIFGPLGMKDSGYDVNAEVLPRRASGYAPGPKGWVNADYIDMSEPYSAGALYSTVDDLLTWEQALFGGKVVNPASLKLMTTDWGYHYGFGLFLARRGPHDEIYHDGGIQGFASSLQWYPADGVTSIVLANFEAAQSNWLGTQLAMTCVGEPGPVEVKLSPSVLDRYAGIYGNGQLSIQIVRESDHLLATTPGQIPVRLYASGERAFFAKIRSGIISFEPGADGRPVAMVLRDQGPDMRLDRLEGGKPRR